VLNSLEDTERKKKRKNNNKKRDDLHHNTFRIFNYAVKQRLIKMFLNIPRFSYF